MSYAAELLRRTTRRLLLIQLAIVLVTAALYFALRGAEELIAALFGGGIALLNTSISAQRLRRASESAAADPRQGMIELYLGAITRFILTPALIAIGILALGLEPVAMIVGFAVAQLAYFFDNRARTGPSGTES